MRFVRWLLAAYVITAVILRVSETAGMRQCGCAEDCWCKRPGLNLFRWVFPFGHSAYGPDEKAARGG